MTNLYRYAWPMNHLAEALTTLTPARGQRPRAAPVALPAAPWDEAMLDQWLGAIGAQAGIEVEPTQAAYADLVALLCAAAPALVRLPPREQDAAPTFLLLCRPGKRRVALLGPDRRLAWVAPTAIQDLLCAGLVAPHLAALQPILSQSQLSPHRQPYVQRAVLAEILGNRPLSGFWLLRVAPDAPLTHQLQRLRLAKPLLLLLGGFLVQLLLGLLAWWLIGRGALAGHFEWGWVIAWALLLLTAIPFQWLTTRAQSRLATDVGSFFKQRLLYGALQLQPEAVRQEGVGQFLGRALAADALEQLALSGGFVALLAFIQVIIAVAVLAAGAGGGWHAGLLAGWIGLTIGLGYRYFRDSRAWNETHRELTNDLVERMVGHRTRLAQEDRHHWHDVEDTALQRYLQDRQQADWSGGWFKAFVGRGWMLLGLGWLAFTLLQNPLSAPVVAVSLGGVLLAQQALNTIVLGIQSLVAALLAWEEVALLVQTTTVPVPPTAVTLQPVIARRPTAAAAPEETLLTLHEVEFRYRAQGRAILQGSNLQISAGDRLLLEGPSGGGKSTLAALLAGLRTPTQGLLLLHGLDQSTIGVAQWRQQVVVAPQFHENHVLTGSLAFNLLMGRRWPPQPEDLRAAEQLCQELGLGPLLARMPAGLQQMVGESGWQLSHGERSRLYIARALLQEAELLILDESFGALDPVTLEGALHTVLARARTLLVIAHP
ncbi:MAG: ABC transporter ATP-binding protein [Caldilineaceae bacterium]|nr:ABC transporter ATP-binding protein [Caldilineaceae bacterium]